MSELVMDVWLAREPEEVFTAFGDPFRLRRWYGAPRGGHRIGAAGDVASGEPFRVDMLDAEGTPFAQLGRIVQVTPGEGLELEMAWEGGSLGREETRASIALRPAEGGTRVEVRQGPFSSQESLEAHRAWWDTCLKRLVRVASGEAPPCFEEFWEESRGFVGPLGVAAYTVLAGLREAGAPPEALAQVEETLYTHLPRLPPETAEVLAAVLRSRVKDSAS
ncbi:SRPBCC domain-containing protein [Myxococcus sp. RHSTA-1-4]|uniref:SRPBCC family protein n=1 Tax=Myxococcus sp. RHSTA-1-4 TaxID=2874601 RepID=UPI001CBBE430|nr:SRPBCC domain-containing protein [Myxococcus sp. RHSTA-1-4]MBZ4420107.1 SRPBCC domain-containing protein [Myxococcus sp. RHSTA-1-4]